MSGQRILILTDVAKRSNNKIVSCSIFYRPKYQKPKFRVGAQEANRTSLDVTENFSDDHPLFCD